MSLARWEPLAAAAARSWGRSLGVTVPVELVMAVMGVENPMGDPLAVRQEPDGRISRGLMQVLEDTARGMGLADPRRLAIPSVGIDYGVHYLAQQLARYRGNVPAAVAAYNAGTARFTERETFVNQGYVDRVLAALRRGGRVVAPWILPVAGVALAVWLLSRRRRLAVN